MKAAFLFLFLAALPVLAQLNLLNDSIGSLPARTPGITTPLFVRAGTNNGTTGTTLAITGFNCSGGNYLVIGVCTSAGAVTITSMTANSVPATLLYTTNFSSSGNGRLSMFGLANPTTGDVSVTFSANPTTSHLNALLFSGVGSTGPLAADYHTINTTSISNNVLSTTNTDLIVDLFSCNASSATPTVGSGQTLRAIRKATSAANLNASTRPGSNTSTPMTWGISSALVCWEGMALHLGAPAAPAPDIMWYKFNDGSGTRPVDSSVNNKTGTTGTGTTWLSSGTGYAITTDGTHCGMFCSTNNIGTNTISLSYWVNRIGAWPSSAIIGELSPNYNSGDGSFILLETSTTLLDVNTRDATATQDHVEFPAVAVGGWHHVFFVMQMTGASSAVNCWLDGNLQTANYLQHSNPNGVFGNFGLYLGARSDATLPVACSFDDVRMWTGDQSTYVSAVYADHQ